MSTGQLMMIARKEVEDSSSQNTALFNELTPVITQVHNDNNPICVKILATPGPEP